jgi:hypothetical protein
MECARETAASSGVRPAPHWPTVAGARARPVLSAHHHLNRLHRLYRHDHHRRHRRRQFPHVCLRLPVVSPTPSPSTDPATFPLPIARDGARTLRRPSLFVSGATARPVAFAHQLLQFRQLSRLYLRLPSRRHRRRHIRHCRSRAVWLRPGSGCALRRTVPTAPTGACTAPCGWTRGERGRPCGCRSRPLPMRCRTRHGPCGTPGSRFPH